MPSPKAGAQRKTRSDKGTHRSYSSEEVDTMAARLNRDFELSQRYGHFPELTIEQNRVIWEAREKGWDVFYPVESPLVQADKTYWGAVEFLKGAK